MNVSFTFKNFDPSQHLRDYANKRFAKLGKFFKDTDNADLQVNLMVEKLRHKADVILDADTVHLTAIEASEDMYATIDLVLDKLEAQLRKQREKMKGKTRKVRQEREVRMNYLNYGDDRRAEPTIVGTDSYVPKPMSVDEAAMQLDTMDHEFLVFRNSETEGVNVIYKRDNGDFGLIDPGF
ncbi:ribosome hibernation-promoting factor, HPF/YfiA family [Desulfovibrio oxyclinae]|jgi:putative sigma-54 modulation protein|uniref:ribosome hibernation-promoting factor, HPF/YfiA family n=1 Tax=Desulfovibrio oxyclinae TaxID=63560 RepID=UPI000382DBA6|nr:ribosome-associated translation inhibitor RaiA [Desulfovibrio oxyclinae]